MSRELPILFKGPLVTATQDGRKTETRRLQGLEKINKNPDDWEAVFLDDKNAWRFTNRLTNEQVVKPCPFGIAGDRLWVRETWYYDSTTRLQLGMPTTKPDDYDPETMYFRADGECCDQIPECCCAEVGPTMWRPSIHMPRWVSRINLEVLEVRLERVQDIDEDGADAEGIFNESGMHLWHCSGRYYHPDQVCKCGDRSPEEEFAALWDSIEKKRGNGWEKNPWVWVVRYRKED